MFVAEIYQFNKIQSYVDIDKRRVDAFESIVNVFTNCMSDNKLNELKEHAINGLDSGDFMISLVPGIPYCPLVQPVLDVVKKDCSFVVSQYYDSWEVICQGVLGKFNFEKIAKIEGADVWFYERGGIYLVYFEDSELALEVWLTYPVFPPGWHDSFL